MQGIIIRAVRVWEWKAIRYIYQKGCELPTDAIKGCFLWRVKIDPVCMKKVLGKVAGVRGSFDLGV